MEVLAVALALLFVAWREREHSKERRHLLDRIQAPQETVIQSVGENLTPAPPHVEFDNDEDYHEAVAERRSP